MPQETINAMLLDVFSRLFEINSPDPDADLRKEYDFDSIDAIELLTEIETYLGRELSNREKKAAMDVRTLRDAEAYVLRMEQVQAA